MPGSSHGSGPWRKVFSPLLPETDPSSVPSEPRRALCRGFIFPTRLRCVACLSELGAVLVGAVTSPTFSRPGPLGKGHLRRQMGLLLMEETRLSKRIFRICYGPSPGLPHALPQLGNK